MTRPDATVDSALLDRRSQLVAGVAAGKLPIRPMTIAGINRSMQARILSRDGGGAGSRVVKIPPGWGSDRPGHFGADVELFVLEGEVKVGSIVLSSYCYAFTPAGVDIPNLSSAGALALLFTSAPIRYDEPDVGAVIRPGVGMSCASGMPWTTSRAADGILRKRLASGADGGARVDLVGVSQWEGHRWRTHECAEEAYFISGDAVVAESLPGGSRLFRYGPSGYYFRPPLVGHGGPGSSVPKQALMLVRSHGERATVVHGSEPPWPDGLRG